MDEIAQRLAAGPATFPHEIDPVRDMLLLVGLDEQRIAQASFLDQRVLTPQTWGRWLPFAEMETRLDPAGRDDAQYIFHIGHVGSTLISRLLGESPNVLALREPQVLRNLTDIVAKKDAIDIPWNPNWLPARSAMLRRMLARCFRHDQRAIVKATSFTSEIAPLLMAGGARSLLLYTSPWSYLTTILAGEVSRKETSLLAGPRLARLARRVDPMPFRLWSMGEGERIAMSWLTEMLSLRAAADALPNGRALWVDFDQFLAAPIPNLGEIATHLGVSFSARALANLLEGPIMQRYSKAPEHGYSSQLRRQLQQEAAHAHIQAVLDGLRWLEKLADENADVARILAHAGGLGAPA